jgi:hypothetical protein
LHFECAGDVSSVGGDALFEECGKATDVVAVAVCDENSGGKRLVERVDAVAGAVAGVEED